MNKSIVLLLMLGILASCKGGEKSMKVLLETSEGNIVLQLYEDTPKHSENFLKLVKDGYYNGVIFHRVIANFMIQSGDPGSKKPTPDGRYGAGGPNYKIPAEILPNHYHKKGALAAARTANPAKESSGSQFYIVQGSIQDAEDLKIMEESKKANNPNFQFNKDALVSYTVTGGTPHLDGDYTVFGEVIEGLDVVDKIALTETRPEDDRPVKNIFIKKASIIKKARHK
ncbi:MAG: peptidylprolyl isomerase [Prevotellaceae bacterium]|jgi:peptidyl-prolyl cis-trans isomerase B (cyclophilin B)|nr:peptidylprolyl isomerase [Prevotellaceae bacterium]